jgi:hypothetical protein
VTQLNSGFTLGGYLAQQPQQQNPYIAPPMSTGAGAVSPYLMSQMMGGQGGLTQQQMMGLGSYDPALLAAMSGNVMMAAGGYADQPTLAVVGEGDAPEYVIPTDPKYRGRAKQLLGQAKKAINGRGGSLRRLSKRKGAGNNPTAAPAVPQFAAGGLFGGSFGSYLPEYANTGQSPQGPNYSFTQQPTPQPMMSAGVNPMARNFMVRGTPIGEVSPGGGGYGGAPSVEGRRGAPTGANLGSFGNSNIGYNFGQNLSQPNGYGGYAPTTNRTPYQPPNAGANYGFTPQQQAAGNPYSAAMAGGWDPSVVHPNPSWSLPDTFGMAQSPNQISAGPGANPMSYGRTPNGQMAIQGAPIRHFAGGGLIGGAGFLGNPGLAGAQRMQQLAALRAYRQQMLGGPLGGYNALYPGYGRNLLPGGLLSGFGGDQLSAYLPQGGSGIVGSKSSGSGGSLGQAQPQYSGYYPGTMDDPNSNPFAPVNLTGGGPLTEVASSDTGDDTESFARGGIIRHYAGGGLINAGPNAMGGGIMPAPRGGMGYAPVNWGPNALGAASSFGGLGGAASFAGLPGSANPAQAAGSIAPPPNMGPIQWQVGNQGTATPTNNPNAAGPIPPPIQGQVGNQGTPNAYNLGGSLQFPNNSGALGQGLAGAGAAIGGPYGGVLGALGNAYTSAYGGYLGAAQQQYNNILGGYQQLMGNQIAGQGQIQGGYGTLGQQIANTLGQGGNGWGIAGPAAQAIQDVYQNQLGQNKEQAAATGLGNTSVLQQENTGAGLQAQKAYAALGSNLAQTYAGYQSQLGLAGLGYANQALQQNAQLGQNQLGWENSVNIQPPNAADYGQLAGQLGQAVTSQQQLGLAQQQLQQQGQLAAAGLAQQGYLGQQGLANQAQQGYLNYLGNLAANRNPYGAGGLGMRSPYGQPGQGYISSPLSTFPGGYVGPGPVGPYSVGGNAQPGSYPGSGGSPGSSPGDQGFLPGTSGAAAYQEGLGFGLSPEEAQQYAQFALATQNMGPQGGGTLDVGGASSDMGGLNFFPGIGNLYG